MRKLVNRCPGLGFCGLHPVDIVLLLTLAAFVGSMLIMVNGCATSNGGTVSIDKSKAVALAELVARKAGKYVALNNPAVAVTVTTAWTEIKNLDGDTFRERFLDALEAYLGQQGVAGSDELRADADNILTILGYDPAAVRIDMAFLQTADVGNIKAIVEAFLQGMSMAAV